MVVMTDDSVVVALNQLRRMAKERKTAELAAAAEQREADQRWSRQSVPVLSGAPARDSRSSALNFPAYGTRFSQPIVSDLSRAAAEPSLAMAEQLRPRRSSLVPALLVAVVMGGAGYAGYEKTQQDLRAALAAKDVVIAEAEAARGRAVEAAARAEQQAKVRIATLTAQLASGADASRAGQTQDPAAGAAATPGAAPAAQAPGPATAPASPSSPSSVAVSASAAKAGSPAASRAGAQPTTSTRSAVKDRVARAPVRRKAIKTARAGAPSASRDTAVPAISAGSDVEARPAPVKVAPKRRIKDDPLAGLRI